MYLAGMKPRRRCDYVCSVYLSGLADNALNLGELYSAKR
jgi:hypothetical protein